MTLHILQATPKQMTFIFFSGRVLFLKIQTIQEVFDGVFWCKTGRFFVYMETFSLKGSENLMNLEIQIERKLIKRR